MGLFSAAVIPVTAVAGVLIALLRPLGGKSFVLVIALLALAGVALTCAGVMAGRSRRR